MMHIHLAKRVAMLKVEPSELYPCSNRIEKASINDVAHSYTSSCLRLALFVILLAHRSLV